MTVSAPSNAHRRSAAGGQVGLGTQVKEGGIRGAGQAALSNSSQGRWAIGTLNTLE